MTFGGVAVSLCFALAAGSAPASGRTVKGLGGIPAEAGRADLARDASARYRGDRPAGDVRRSGRVVYGYGLSSDTTRATLVVHGAADAAAAAAAAAGTWRDIAGRLERYRERMK